MTDTLTERPTFALGDRITYTENGTDYVGTVFGIHTAETPGVDGGGDPYPSLWVANVEGETAYPFSHTVLTARQAHPPSDERNQWKDTGTGGEAQGHWVSTRYDSPRHAVEESPALSESAAQITALEATVSDLRAQVAAAHDVVTRIGEALNEHADRSDWCGTYESLVNEVYDVLPSTGGFDREFRDAAKRSHEWTITYSGTATVTARTEDEARDTFHSGGIYLGYSSSGNVELLDVEQSED